MQIIKVLIPKINLFPLDYKVPKDNCLKLGDLVIVSFYKKNVTGIVWEKDCFTHQKKLKIINTTLSLVNNHYKNIGISNIELIKKASDYYLASLGSVSKLVLPFDINPRFLNENIEETPLNCYLPALSQEQLNILFLIKSTKKPILLKGVTGSGKTEVYFHLLAETIKNKKQSLILLPEISLSLDVVRRFSERFGLKAAIWNSSVSKTEKRNILYSIINGSIKVVIGTRSSLFLPYKSLGLIIVDEEHDTSYKQEEGIMYNARDMAVLKAHLLGIRVVLVSATPSIETIYNVNQGKYFMAELENRFNKIDMPAVEIVDMRNSKLSKNSSLSIPLINAIKDTIQQEKQCLLFLNRRGYAPLMICKSCGYRFQCKKCSVSMVVHRLKGLMECHYCGYTAQVYDKCLECGKKDSLILYGQGIEKVEEQVKRLFPDLRIETISRERNRQVNQIQNLLHEMKIGNIDILIGTQIITKGYHFPKLSLVGVIDADLGFLGGNLRSAERTFQLLHQVGGRAGRDKVTRGKVLLQSYFPENKALTYLAKGDEKRFIEMELLARKEAKMPPFTRMAVINIAGFSQEKTLSLAKDMSQKAPSVNSVRILGPAEAQIFKVSNRYRYKILVICEKSFKIQKYLSLWLSKLKISSSFKIKADIDPYNFI